MNKSQKIGFACQLHPLRTFVISLSIATILASAGCSSSQPSLDDFGPLPEFKLTERSDKPVGLEDLKGKIWIGSFIFTSCAGPCSQISANMARLQEKLQNRGGVKLVTFTVHPEFDTPAVLKVYANRFEANPDRWLFLTGPPEPLYELLRGGFKVGVEQTQGSERRPGNEVTHSTKLVLVDSQGHLRGYYDGTSPESLDQLVRDAGRLEQTSSLPAINAILNSTCALLLIAGYLAVRKRALILHKFCMLAALAVSAAFLSCYLYYHFVVRDGKPTPFLGTGMIRTTYFTILISHTILAVCVAPMAIASAYFGLRDRLARHVRLARWTLPIWLYVSLTGVAVYWMLYRL